MESQESLSFVSRPVQLDSYDLDKSFVDLLGGKIEALQIDALNEYSSELRLLLKIYLWFQKVYKTGTSVGMESYSLEFADSQKRPLNVLQRVSFLFEPLTSYFVDRFSGSLHYTTEKRIQKVLAVIQSLEVINYFLFLYNGRYRTLLERIFSIQVFGPQKQYSSNWNKTQMVLNRELNWRLLSAILTLSLPMLLNNRFINRHLLAPLLGRTVKSSAGEQCCAICTRPATNTVSPTGCRHLFCYVCLATELSQYGQYDCSKCGIIVKDLESLRNSNHHR